MIQTEKSFWKNNNGIVTLLRERLANHWSDLLNGEVIQAGEQSIVLEPYQTVWLANKQHQLDAT